MSRIMIAGTGSGCGKTTVTCGLLGALKAMNKNIISFKAGPDYIDPMFHKKTTGIEARNLDVFLMGEENVKLALRKHAEHKDIAVIEGAMGLYDGIGSGSYGSANHLSIVTDTPVILVVNARGMSRSVCAGIQGYKNFEKNNICGVVLNNVTEAMYPFYQGMIEKELDIPVIGFMPNIPEAQIESRHLGLITADEIVDIQEKLGLLADAAMKHIDMDRLFSIAGTAKAVECFPGAGNVTGDGILNHVTDAAVQNTDDKVTIYVADDEAFCFFYEDNHDVLRSLGADIKFFSPLHDEKLPYDAAGIVLWGGYPELHASELEQNRPMRENLSRRIEAGLPVYAECGGFMYLQESVTDMSGESFAMLDILEGQVRMTNRLQNFGYATLESVRDNSFCKKGTKINAHSFHHSTSSNEGDCFMAAKRSTGKTYPCIIAKENIFAGYPHLHFLNNTEIAENFVKLCKEYTKEVRHGIYHKSPGNRGEKL